MLVLIHALPSLKYDHLHHHYPLSLIFNSSAVFSPFVSSLTIFLRFPSLAVDLISLPLCLSHSFSIALSILRSAAWYLPLALPLCLHYSQNACVIVFSFPSSLSVLIFISSFLPFSCDTHTHTHTHTRTHT